MTRTPAITCALAALLAAPLAASAASASTQATGADIVFQMPYESPASPDSAVLTAPTSFLAVDLYLLIDNTGSMTAELNALQTDLPTIIQNLTCLTSGSCDSDTACSSGYVCHEGSCVQLSGSPCAPDIWTGVGQFNECNTYLNLVSLQSDPSVTANALPAVGSGSAEAPLQAAGQVGLPSLGTNSPNCSGSGFGCPGFRNEALRVLVQITDADNQAGSSCSWITASIAADALVAQGIRYGAVVGNDDDSGAPGTPLSMAQDLCYASGSLDLSNQPFTVFAENAAVPNAVRDLVGHMLTSSAGPVTIEIVDDDGDAVDARSFVDYVEVNVTAGGCASGLTTQDTDGDARHDAYVDVPVGASVCWTIVPAANTFVPETSAEQSFPAFVVVRAQGGVVHTTRLVFVVPPTTVSVADPTIAGLSFGAPRPNPTTGTVALDYSIPAQTGPVSIRVYDSQGRHIRTLLDTSGEAAGTVFWDGRNHAGLPVRAGMYYARMQAESRVFSRQIAIVQ